MKYQSMMKKNDAITMTEIARLCNVSKVTVSRAFTNPEKLKKETRERILKTATTIGYTYNALAGMLRKSDNPFLGIIATHSNDSQTRNLIMMIQQEAEKENLEVLFGLTRMDWRKELKLIKKFIEYRAAVIILSGVTRPLLEYHQEILRNPHSPVLIVGEYEPWDGLHCIGMDIKKVAYDLTTYLIRLGHKRIGILSGPYDVSNRGHRRLEGYRKALSDNAVPLRAEFISLTWEGPVENKFNLLSAGRNTVLELMSRKCRPTAIVFPSDEFALGGLLGAQELGLRIPEDISIAGMFDNDFSPWLTPPLTTMRTPTETIADLTRQFIAEARLGLPLAGWQQCLDAELVERDSCAACAS